MDIQEIIDYVMTLPAEEIRRLTAQDVLGMKLQEFCGVPYYCAGPNDYSVDQKDWKPDEDRNQSRIFTDQIIELYGSGAMYEGMLHVQPSLLSYLTTALDESRAGLIAHYIHKQGNKRMKVKFSIQIHSCFATLSSNDVWLNYETDLPFAPFVGLSYKDGDLHIGDVEEIVWDHQSQSFTCYVEEDKTFYDVKNALKNYSDTAEFKALVQKYLDAGWSRKS